MAPVLCPNGIFCCCLTRRKSTLCTLTATAGFRPGPIALIPHPNWLHVKTSNVSARMRPSHHFPGTKTVHFDGDAFLSLGSAAPIRFEPGRPMTVAAVVAVEMNRSGTISPVPVARLRIARYSSTRLPENMVPFSAELPRSRNAIRNGSSSCSPTTENVVWSASTASRNLSWTPEIHDPNLELLIGARSETAEGEGIFYPLAW